MLFYASDAGSLRLEALVVGESLPRVVVTVFNLQGETSSLVRRVGWDTVPVRGWDGSGVGSSGFVTDWEAPLNTGFLYEVVTPTRSARVEVRVLQDGTPVATNLATNPGPVAGSVDGYRVPSYAALAPAVVAGAPALAVTRAAGSGPGAVYVDPDENYAVVAGDVVRFSADVAAAGDPAPTSANLWLGTYGGAATTEAANAPAVTIGPGFQRLSGTWTVTAPGTVRALTRTTDTRGEGAGLYVRRYLVSINWEPRGFFDGDTPAGGGYVYGWDGAPGSSTSTRSTAPTPYPYGLLQDPVSPRTSVQVNQKALTSFLTKDSLRKRTRKATVSTVEVLGGSAPVAFTGTRQAPSAVSFDVVTQTTGEYDGIDSLIRAGGVWTIRSHPAWGLPPVCYLTAGDITEDRRGLPRGDPLTVWTVTGDMVAAPTGRYRVPVVTRAAFAATKTGMTRADVAASYAGMTRFEVARSVSIGGQPGYALVASDGAGTYKVLGARVVAGGDGIYTIAGTTVATDGDGTYMMGAV